jgi:predicted TPR repeat methyltransferase
LEVEPGNVKALLRRGAAYEGSSQLQLAVAEYQHVLRLQPINKEAAAALDKLQPPPAPDASDAAMTDS